MLLDPSPIWPLLTLLPFIAVAVLVARLVRQPPLWRRIAGGTLVGLALFLIVGAVGYVGFVETVGFNRSAAFPTAAFVGLGGVVLGAVAVALLRWRSGSAGRREV